MLHIEVVNGYKNYVSSYKIIGTYSKKTNKVSVIPNSLDY